MERTWHSWMSLFNHLVSNPIDQWACQRFSLV